MDTVSRSLLAGLQVLVVGAGVAGPAAASWLSRYGAAVTVIEIAPALRTSGFAVDFRGPTQLGVLEEMGVAGTLRQLATGAGAMRFVDARGRLIFELPAAFAGGDLEVHRRDLSRVLVEQGGGRAQYVFGDTPVAIEDGDRGVTVGFRSGVSRVFDLVVGADGMHSGVRRLAFGPERQFVKQLGYVIAGWELANDGRYPRTPDHYGEPGRMFRVGEDLRDPSRALAQTIFSCPRLDVDWHDLEAQRLLVERAVREMGWRVPEVLPSLAEAPDLYFDGLSRVQVPSWSRGRVVLLGDAAHGVTLGGMGVGTGVVGARVLAGELALARGRHESAFPAYEAQLRSRIARWQGRSEPGRFLAPRSRAGLWFRNRLLRSSAVQRMLLKSTDALATDSGLPAYPPPDGEGPQKQVSASSTTR